jgi:Cyclin, C-terminal domain
MKQTLILYRKLKELRLIPSAPKLKSLLPFLKDNPIKHTLLMKMLKKVEGIAKNDWKFLDMVGIYKNWNLEETSPVDRLALVLVDSFILDYSSLKHQPELVVASAVAVARKLIFRDMEDDWNQKHIVATKIERSKFTVIFDDMFYVAYLLFKDPVDENTEKNTALIECRHEIEMEA